MEKTKNKKQEPKKIESCSCNEKCHCGSVLIPMLLIIIAATIIFVIGICFGVRIGGERRYSFNENNFKNSDHYNCPFRQGNPITGNIPTTTDSIPTTTPGNPVK